VSEQWTAVDGYEGVYAVSDRGNVMSMNYAKSKLPGLMSSSLRRGYRSVYFCRPGQKGRWFTVHALVARAFLGERPPSMHINHKNGVKTDNRVENLEYCTPSENRLHSFRIGTQSNKGERHSQARLNDENVREIRSLLSSGVSRKEIALKMGVTPAAITNIALGRNWTHVLPAEVGG
jgi:HNH endonuclease/NUMOD4 motif